MEMPHPNKLRANSIWNLLWSLVKNKMKLRWETWTTTLKTLKFSLLFFKHESCSKPWRLAAEDNIWMYTLMKGYFTDLNNQSTMDSIPYSVITFKCLGLFGFFLFYFSYLICNKSPNENWFSEKLVIPANTDTQLQVYKIISKEGTNFSFFNCLYFLKNIGEN